MKLNLCHVVHQDTILVYMQAAVLVACRDAGLLKIENHGNHLERRCSKTARGVLGTLPGKPYYVFMSNVKAKPVNLPIFMIVG